MSIKVGGFLYYKRSFLFQPKIKSMKQIKTILLAANAALFSAPQAVKKKIELKVQRFSTVPDLGKFKDV